MKSFLLKFLGKESVIDKALQKEITIDPKKYPLELISELRHGSIRNFISAINSPEAEPLLTLRKLVILHNVILHEPALSENFEHIGTGIVSNDDWLNQHILHPYSVFLYKIINSGGLYAQCKLRGVVEISFKMLFYVINTLNQLFPCVKKISSLHRYYSTREKQLRTTATTDFVMMSAYEAHELYNYFKAMLVEMISRPEVYIKTESDQNMIQYVLGDVLNNINEQMKNLFLDKYYFPYGKGLGVKLFRQQDLTGQKRQFVDKLNLMNSQTKSRRPKKKITLDKLLFDESGRLNPQIYMTLSQIRQGDESFSERAVHSDVKRRTFRTQISEQTTENI